MEVEKRSEGLNQWLRFMRLGHNLTQAQLARRAGLSLTTISDLERSQRDPEGLTLRNLRRLARALDMNLFTLISNILWRHEGIRWGRCSRCGNPGDLFRYREVGIDLGGHSDFFFSLCPACYGEFYGLLSTFFDQKLRELLYGDRTGLFDYAGEP